MKALAINQGDGFNTKMPGPLVAILGFIVVLSVYGLSQLAGLIILIYPAIKHWSGSQSNYWLNHSIYAQFWFVLVAEAVTVGAIFFVLKLYKVDIKGIGLRKPKLQDPLYGIAAFIPYYILYIALLELVSVFYKGINVSQQQNIGFNSVHGAAQLIVTFISLVILPPVAEEIMFRGFLYSSLKKGVKAIPTALITSVLFASAHLAEGVGGAFWIGAIDTFTLSIVLISLRELTGGLWSSMTLHGLKNGVAYVVLYITPLVSMHSGMIKNIF
jgi:membrane protease YdiL (CAAX protease family)